MVRYIGTGDDSNERTLCLASL